MTKKQSEKGKSRLFGCLHIFFYNLIDDLAFCVAETQGLFVVESSSHVPR